PPHQARPIRPDPTMATRLVLSATAVPLVQSHSCLRAPEVFATVLALWPIDPPGSIAFIKLSGTGALLGSTKRRCPMGSTLHESVSIQPEPEHVRQDGLSETMSQLSRDVASLKDTFAQLASQAGGEAAKAFRNMSQTVASQVGTTAGNVADTGSDLASAAKERAKTFASELEGMARQNPLATIAGTLLVGVIIGMMTRGR